MFGSMGELYMYATLHIGYSRIGGVEKTPCVVGHGTEAEYCDVSS